jgi:hypothetical protein
MAIYHFSAKIISRANGSSALASAAYRSRSRLYDHRLDRDHDFSNKSGVIHSEVMTPGDVPEELREREGHWNAVEEAEKRIDASSPAKSNSPFPGAEQRRSHRIGPRFRRTGIRRSRA